MENLYILHEYYESKHACLFEKDILEYNKIESY